MSTQALSAPISSLSLLLVQTQAARWKAATPDQLTGAHLYLDIAKFRLPLACSWECYDQHVASKYDVTWVRSQPMTDVVYVTLAFINWDRLYFVLYWWYNRLKGVYQIVGVSRHPFHKKKSKYYVLPRLLRWININPLLIFLFCVISTNTSYKL